MNNVIFVFNSVTGAKKAERAAMMHGISGSVIHTPKSLSENGCSHSLRVNERYANVLIKYFKEFEIGYKSIYDEKIVKGEYSYRRRNENGIF